MIEFAGGGLHITVGWLRAKLFFAWYDLWIGVFIDHRKQIVYVCPLPMVVIMLWDSRGQNRWL